LLLVSIALTSCRGSQKNRGQKPELQALADKILGPENVIEYNEARTFALCQQKPQADHARRQYRYVVVRLENNTIVQQGVFSMGYVKWVDNRSIEVFSGSVSPTGEGSSKKIIQLTSPVE
jgi:hypothetical protein